VFEQCQILIFFIASFFMAIFMTSFLHFVIGKYNYKTVDESIKNRERNQMNNFHFYPPIFL
jgi:hypothetical protein